MNHLAARRGVLGQLPAVHVPVVALDLPPRKARAQVTFIQKEFLPLLAHRPRCVHTHGAAARRTRVT